MTTLTRLTVSRFAWVPCGTNAHRFLRIGQAQMRTLVLADGTIVYGVWENNKHITLNSRNLNATLTFTTFSSRIKIRFLLTDLLT